MVFSVCYDIRERACRSKQAQKAMPSVTAMSVSCPSPHLPLLPLPVPLAVRPCLGPCSIMTDLLDFFPPHLYPTLYAHPLVPRPPHVQPPRRFQDGSGGSSARVRGHGGGGGGGGAG